MAVFQFRRGPPVNGGVSIRCPTQVESTRIASCHSQGCSLVDRENRSEVFLFVDEDFEKLLSLF